MKGYEGPYERPEGPSKGNKVLSKAIRSFKRPLIGQGGGPRKRSLRLLEMLARDCAHSLNFQICFAGKLNYLIQLEIV